jgi:putative alpha-1,2-mannosidase
MAKAGPDVTPDGEPQGGFSSDNSSILGFSHMHDSGTGGVSPYNLNMRRQFALNEVCREHLWGISLSLRKPAAPMVT